MGSLPFDVEARAFAREHGLSSQVQRALQTLLSELQQAGLESTLGSVILPLAREGEEEGAPPEPLRRVEVSLAQEEGFNSSSLLLGAKIEAGRYTVRGLLGRGGMAEVYRVWDRELQRVLAMKVVRQDIAGRPGNRIRFCAEAVATARLQHPGVVPVHEMGTLSDGRLYYTMREVQGRTLKEALREFHRRQRGEREKEPGLRRLMEFLLRACEAVAYAHARGVIHRDLKPENIMLGDFGEVLVVDWGLAKKFRDDLPDESLTDSMASPSSPGNQERARTVTGTPAYMPPEQAEGQENVAGPPSDVYSLGAVLYEILCGHPPYQGRSALDVLTRVQRGPPPSLAAQVVTEGVLEAPEELIRIAERAMARDMGERFTDASALAAEIGAWLDGVKKRDQALNLLEGARAQIPSLFQLREKALKLRADAREILAGIPSHENSSRRLAGWAKEDEAALLEREAEIQEVEITQTVGAALAQVPHLEEGHAVLADIAWRRHREAEAQDERALAARYEILLRAHDRQRTWQDYLRGRGALTLVTDPPGARVELIPYVEVGRKLVEGEPTSLGTTPLKAVELPMGSYLLLLTARGRLPVRYPVRVERQEHWDGAPPGENEPWPVRLPRFGELEEGEVYVPGGWYASGGDPEAGPADARIRRWLPSFAMQRFPVTNREYLAFLEALVREGREDEALRFAPRERSGNFEKEGDVVYGRREDGGFHLVPDADGDVWDPDWPVVLVELHCARAYGRWKSQPGREYRVPTEREWEKAGRGVDGRLYPWGNLYDPSWGCTRDSHAGRRMIQRVDSFPVDESPYGVRGLSGNVRDWCVEAQQELPVGREPRGVLRGGSWVGGPRAARLTVRNDDASMTRWNFVGFRLVRSLG